MHSHRGESRHPASARGDAAGLRVGGGGHSLTWMFPFLPLFPSRPQGRCALPGGGGGGCWPTRQRGGGRDRSSGPLKGSDAAFCFAARASGSRSHGVPPQSGASDVSSICGLLVFPCWIPPLSGICPFSAHASSNREMKMQNSRYQFP